MPYPNGRGRGSRSSNAAENRGRAQNPIYQYSQRPSMPPTPSSAAETVYFNDVLTQTNSHPRTSLSLHFRQLSDQRIPSSYPTQRAPQNSPPKHQSSYVPAQVSPHRRGHMPIPLVTDVPSLIRAVQMEPEVIFQHLQLLINERDSLRIQVHSLQEDNKHILADYASAREIYEKLSGIWTQKQFLLWKFIERVQGSEVAGEAKKSQSDIAGGGQWVPRNPSKIDGEVVTADDVDVMWSAQCSRVSEFGGWGNLADFVEGSLAAEEKERGRSRFVKSPMALKSEVSTKVDGSLSFVESLDLGGDDDYSKLDPSAKPFEPSPTRADAQRGGPTTEIPALTINTKICTGTIAPPSSSGSATNTRHPSNDNTSPSPKTPPTDENPWIEVKAPKRGRQGDLSTNSNTSSRESSNTRGLGKKKKKLSSRGGKGWGFSSFDQYQRDSSFDRPSGERELILDADRERHKNKENITAHCHPSTQKSKPPWGLMESQSHKKQLQRERKVSPEIIRITSLPPYPIPSNPSRESHVSFNSSQVATSSLSTKYYNLQRAMPPPPRPTQVSSTVIDTPRYHFMSQARLQATLNSIPEPYDRICPFSLLSGQPCHVDGCELLHLCHAFNCPFSFTTSVKTANEDFPPLGAPFTPSRSISTPTASPCQAANGTSVKEGDICALGNIHLRPSCGEEVEGVNCRRWTSSQSSSSGGRKSRALSLDYNFIAPPHDLQPSPTTILNPTCLALPSSGTSTQSEIHPLLPSQGLGSGFPAEGARTETGERKQSLLEDRETHFERFLHERDGAGRDVWYARVINASLRGAHEGGVWGVTLASPRHFLVDGVESGGRESVGGNVDRGGSTSSAHGRGRLRSITGNYHAAAIGELEIKRKVWGHRKENYVWGVKKREVCVQEDPEDKCKYVIEDGEKRDEQKGEA